MFQVPVYWPFILIYLFWLVILTICKHLHHMRKYGYSFDDFDTRRETHFMDITNSDIL